MSTTESKPKATDPETDDDVLQPQPRAGTRPESEREDANDFDRREAADRLLAQAERVLLEVRKLGNVATETAGDAFGSARDASVDAVESGRDRVRDLRTDVETYVERQPLKSLLIAAGVGAVFGLWSRR